MQTKIIESAEKDMHKRVEVLKNELSKLRTGRAHPGILDHVKVSYYGNDVPLSQVASVSVTDARTLTISPWEKPMVKVIEKAITNSGLGLNPIADANLVRVPMPVLTEERRKELVKVVKNEGEQARVGIRNIRRDANNTLKDQLKKKEISEDIERRTQDVIQKLTDKIILEIDQLLKVKEEEMMQI
jgi:ribosome recycling factor